MKLLNIPEYHSLNAASDFGTASVTVKIDGKSGMMPGIRMEPRVLARLVEAFFSGALDFMSFDEHLACSGAISRLWKRNSAGPSAGSVSRLAPTRKIPASRSGVSTLRGTPQAIRRRVLL